MKTRNKLGFLIAALALSWPSARAQGSLPATLAQVYGHGTDARQVELPTGARLACDADQVRVVAARRVRNGYTQIAARCANSTSFPVVAWVRSEYLPQPSARVLVAASAKARLTPPLIKAGARVRLELTGQDMLITMPVICLGSGRAGETIRVMDTTGRLRYRARVMSADLVRGELE